jgi:hypothetical protein
VFRYPAYYELEYVDFIKKMRRRIRFGENG